MGNFIPLELRKKGERRVSLFLIKVFFLPVTRLFPEICAVYKLTQSCRGMMFGYASLIIADMQNSYISLYKLGSYNFDEEDQ